MTLTLSYDPVARTFRSVALDGKPLADVGEVHLTPGGSVILDANKKALFSAEAGGVHDAVPAVAKAAKDIAACFAEKDEKNPGLAPTHDELFGIYDTPRGR